MMGEDPGLAFQSVKKLQDTNALIVTWEDGDTQVYPYIWLRDNCQCRDTCWHSDGLQIKAMSRSVLDVDVTADTIDINGSNPKMLDIIWSDGHKSRYESSWLRGLRFAYSNVDVIFYPELRYWGSDVMEKQLKTYKFDEILSSDEVLYEWLLEIKQLGLTLVKAAPLDKGQLQRIGERVEYIQWTSHGPTFQVEVRDNGLESHTSTMLPLHTDSSFYNNLPAVMMLHCIKQCEGEGGENMLVDGIKAAEELKNKHPDAFKILTTIVLEHFERGNGTDYYGKFYSLARHPVISLDERGEIGIICYGPHARTAVLHCPVEQVEPFYRALSMFHNILYKPENVLKYKLQEGDIICVNNSRVLHGRTAFDASKGTASRHLEGGYLGWDPINCRMRILQEKLLKK